jgi:hypothetical protein
MISLLNRIDKMSGFGEEKDEENKKELKQLLGEEKEEGKRIIPLIGSRLSPRTTTVQLKQEDHLTDDENLKASTSNINSSPPLPLDEAETLR